MNESTKKLKLEEQIALFLKKIGINFNKEKVLGKGSFGEIYEVVDQFGRIFAMKILKKNISHITSKDKLKALVKKLQKEVAIQMSLKASTVIRGVWCGHTMINKELLYFVIMEKAFLKNLNYLIQYFHYSPGFEILCKDENYWFNRLSENTARYLMYNVFYAIEYLHRSNIVHLDIKPSNILLVRGYKAKLSDFSISSNQNKNDKDKKFTLIGGTHNYLGPEAYTQHKEIDECYADRVDIFALGMTLYYVMYNSFLDERIKNYSNMMNEGKYSYDEVVNMVNKIRERINDSTVSEELKEFMNRMVVADYKERADIYELIDMKWINGKKEMMRSLNEINEEEGQKMFIELQKSEYYEKKDTKKKKKFKYNRK